jgi:hypothetical protein
VIVYVVFVSHHAGSTMRVSTHLPEAEGWAADLSMARGGLETQVLQFVAGYALSRKPISLFANGTRQRPLW